MADLCPCLGMHGRRPGAIALSVGLLALERQRDHRCLGVRIVLGAHRCLCGMWGWNGLAVGGNPEVGCGDGVAGLPSEVYDNNTLYTSATICVSEEDSLALIHRDSYGDGGSDFAIALGGNEAFGFDGSGSGNDWSFQPVLAVADLPCLAESIFADTMTWVGSTEDASVSPNEPAPPALGCGTYGGGVKLDWKTPFGCRGKCLQAEVSLKSAPATNKPHLTLSFALWRVTDCADFESYELVNANDDAGCGLGRTEAPADALFGRRGDDDASNRWLLRGRGHRGSECHDRGGRRLDGVCGRAGLVLQPVDFV